jgi:hypothetical protein
VVIGIQKAALVVAAIACVVACTGKPQNGALQEPLPAASVSKDVANFKSFDASSLVEVKTFADLPDSVKALAIRDGMNASGEGPNGRSREFMVGGISQTSALVTYEQFGYIPTFIADAYVHSGSEWIPVRRWEITSVTTLKDALNLINMPSK